jgi:hypothetical protein
MHRTAYSIDSSERQRHVEPERLGGFEIDNQFHPGGPSTLRQPAQAAPSHAGAASVSTLPHNSSGQAVLFFSEEIWNSLRDLRCHLRQGQVSPRQMGARRAPVRAIQ